MLDLAPQAEVASDEAFFAPIGRDQFVTDFWGRRPVRLPGWQTRFATLYSLDAFQRDLVGAVSPDRPRAPPPLLKAVHNRDGGGAVFHPPANLAMALFDGGMTLCASGLEAHDARLSHALDWLKGQLKFAGKAEINAYYSPEGEGFAWHYDCQHVFILQIAGSKRWEFSEEPGVHSPPLAIALNVASAPQGSAAARLAGLDIRLPADLEIHEGRLNPGDALYLPPGVWHRAFADTYSFALTLTLQPLSLAQVLRSVVTLLANTDVVGRRDLHRGTTDPRQGLGSEYDSASNAFLSNLWTKLAKMDAADLVKLYGELQQEELLQRLADA
ncbi:MAG: hypothetical protein EPO51_19935 [Phenylobacterium sp.]|uniref:JmjC domain-containing protein n=1 Tax=Phenylobacterium sp. TaxID=1871053 RepID=UPI0011F80663|nr:cupin domain-containing protein [Phenylobacterium sp.]TAJ69802.1 MAG: hypothetical protein EPO51_19935 [Phenylobacterium sp.]